MTTRDLIVTDVTWVGEGQQQCDGPSDWPDGLGGEQALCEELFDWSVGRAVAMETRHVT